MVHHRFDRRWFPDGMGCRRWVKGCGSGRQGKGRVWATGLGDVKFLDIYVCND